MEEIGWIIRGTELKNINRTSRGVTLGTKKKVVRLDPSNIKGEQTETH